uniref:Uncharacterized protein n=1 Tax=Anguilla anguilla TaxID=7936 RepID=A0A0E9QY25_ANGAN
MAALSKTWNSSFYFSPCSSSGRVLGFARCSCPDGSVILLPESGPSCSSVSQQ